MDPTQLLGASSPFGLPAPYWFILFFKVLGFTLHTIPMNLWYAGIFVAAILGVWGGANGKQFAHRWMKQMPIAIALGINFGIVPLLFTQVAYYKVFYVSTILMAWFWFSVIALLMVAYYGVYVYAIQVREGRVTRLGMIAGWVSATFFTAIGFIFANNFSLMVNLGDWQMLWQATSIAGAPLGLALNVFDATLLPRWLMMPGLALTTVAAYIAVDAAFFAGKEHAEYTRWAIALAWKICTLGIVWFAITGSLYIFVTMRAETRALLLSPPLLGVTVLTALAPGLTWLLLAAQRGGATRRLASATALAQVGVLALNAVSRHCLG